jgi:sporulation protein YtfJ
MQSIQEMLDVNTVVGEAVETKDGTVIVPVSRVSAGFAAGDTDYERARQPQAEPGQQLPFGGGSGAGVTVQPVGFLVVASDSIRFLGVDDRAVIDRALDVAPELLERITALFKRDGAAAVRSQPRQPVKETTAAGADAATVKVPTEPEY